MNPETQESLQAGAPMAFSIYKTEALRQRIELINHLMEFGRQVIVINGPPRFGKTTLLEAVQSEAPDTWIFINLNAGPTLNRATLLDRISTKLDFEPSQKFSEQEVCEEIGRRLEILARSNQIVVLAIDDAHQLPTDTHGLLLALAHNEAESAELRVIMAADPDQSALLDNLQQSAEHSALVHPVELPSFDREQTASLLSWWAEHEAIERKFSGAEIDAIFEQSRGVPGDILVIARQSRLARTDSTFTRADPVLRYALGGVVILLVVVVIAFFNKDPKEPDVEEIALELPQPTAGDEQRDEAQQPGQSGAAPALGLQPAAVKPTAAGNDPLGDRLTQRLIEHLGQPDPTASSSAIEAQASPATPSKVAETEAQPTAAAPDAPPADPSPDPSPDPGAVTAVPAADTPPRAEVAESVADPVPQVTVKLRSPPPAEPKTITKTITKAMAKTKAKPVEQTAVVAPSIKAEAQPSAADESSYSLAHLKSTYPAGYVLQLFGVRERAAAERFVRSRGVARETAIVATEHQNQPWFVVIFGQYQDRQQALAAAKNLPDPLADLSPWPRPLNTLD